MFVIFSKIRFLKNLISPKKMGAIKKTIKIYKTISATKAGTTEASSEQEKKTRIIADTKVRQALEATSQFPLSADLAVLFVALEGIATKNHSLIVF